MTKRLFINLSLTNHNNEKIKNLLKLIFFGNSTRVNFA